MIENSIDHEARRMATLAQSSADRAMDQIKANQDTLKGALHRLELFEAEMRSANLNSTERIHHVETALTNKLNDMASGIHRRLNTASRLLVTILVGIVISGLGYIALAALTKI